MNASLIAVAHTHGVLIIDDPQHEPDVRSDFPDIDQMLIDLGFPEEGARKQMRAHALSWYHRTQLKFKNANHEMPRLR